MLLNKKFVLMAIFLVILLAMSAVSANDLNATDDLICKDVSVDDNLEITQDDNLSTTYTVSGNTFNDIQNVIDSAKSGDTIELSGTYYGNGKEISISKAITIDGKGKATLDAKKLSRIFIIENDNGFSLKNINFVNGNAVDDFGGAVLLNYVNDVEISGCTFKDNAARSGGAISASGNNVNVSDCNFINDRAISEGYVTQGGAVRIGFDTRNYRFDKCSFINCSSGNSNPETNGAIYSEASNLNIFNCEFVNGFGGALEVKKNTKIVNCNFVNNSFIRDNVLYSDIPTVYLGGYGSDMSYCNFISNVGSTMVAVYGSGATLSNCDFKNNIIFANVLDVGSYGESSIYKCSFADNGYNHDYLPAISISPKLFSITSGYNNLTVADIVIEDDIKNVYGEAVALENNILTVTNSASAKGEITVRISDKTFTKSVDGGKTQFDLSSIKPGTYQTNIFYSGDDYEYESSEMNIPITIKSNVEINAADVSKYFGGSEKFTVKLAKDDKPLSGAAVKISVNGKIFSVKTDSNGKATIDLNLPVGAFDVVSEYDGISNTSKVTVKSTVGVSDVTGTYVNSKVTATFLNTNGNHLANAKVTFKINNNDYAATTNSNGVATANVELNVGTYDVTAVNPTTKEEKQFKLSVGIPDAKIVPQNLNAEYASGAFTFKLVDADTNKPLAGKKLSFVIYNSGYTVTTDENGIATLDNTNMTVYKLENGKVSFYSHLDVATHPFSVKGVDSSMKVSELKGNLTVSQAAINIKMDAYREYEGSDKPFIIIVTNARTGEPMKGIDLHACIENTLAKDYYLKTDNDGIGIINASSLIAGNYPLTVSNNDTKNMKEEMASSSITILDASLKDVKLTAANVTKTYGSSAKLVVKLLDGNGNPIANADVNVMMDGASTPLKTNANGQATMAIANAPGTYSAIVTYEGLQTTAKVIVKKATPKITAKAKTFKKSVKTKKYTVTLNVKQKVKVAIKVNKKTYYAYTNAKGQATFKITKLTKNGKYTATVSSVANKYYNKAKSVNVKITVK